MTVVQKTCSKCKFLKDIGAFYPDAKRKSGFRPWCKECHKTFCCKNKKTEKYKNQQRAYRAANSTEIRSKQVETRKRLRRDVVAMFGGRCGHCGFEDIRALQLDHINGGGGKERKAIGDVWTLYKSISRMGIAEASRKYQILCANCNWIKRHTHGEFGRV